MLKQQYQNKCYEATIPTFYRQHHKNILTTLIADFTTRSPAIAE